jgi:hypothetical protein
MEHSTVYAISMALLSPFPTEIQYTNGIYQPIAFRKQKTPKAKVRVLRKYALS